MMASANCSLPTCDPLRVLRALRGEQLLCGLRHCGLLAGAKEAEELHFDDAGVVAGLDAQDALEDDLLGERLLLRLGAELLRDRAGDQVLEQRAVERADQRDRQRGADDGGVATE